MTIDDIKKAIREIEISYDYSHRKEDYDIVLNLTELANLIKTLQDKAIDDFAEKLIRYVDCGHLCSPTEVRWSDLSVVEMVKEIAEQLKVGGENEQR